MDLGKPVKTNVQKIYEAIASKGTDGIPQVKYYGVGVGTGYTLTDKFFGGATGIGIDRNIKDAYRFIMWNYEPGDELYFFGFSRGAYTARSLTGLIRNCGVLQSQYLNLVNEAYSLYRDRNAITHPDSDLMMAFKNKYSQITRIKFIGVWDTVGALGIPLSMWSNKQYQFHDVKLSTDIDYAFHAIALDETRRLFQPTLWEVTQNTKNPEQKQVVEQVWFPGVHSNVGGGYADTGLSDIALLWMIEKAQSTGLGFRENYLKERIKPDSKGAIRKSTTGVFAVLSKKLRNVNQPGKGKLYDDESETYNEYDIQRNEKIHYSCFERSDLITNYKPKNLEVAIKYKTPTFPDISTWKEEWKKFIPNELKEFIRDLRNGNDEPPVEKNVDKSPEEESRIV